MERWHTTVPLHRLEVPAPHRLPFAIGSFDTIGPLSRAAFPHRHTFYEIVHVTGGSGSHVIDARRWLLDPPHLGVIVPGQVHSWDRAYGLRGWVMLFDDAFLIAHPADRDLLRGLGERPWLCLTGQDAADIASVMKQMRREYRQRRPGMIPVLQAYLHILLLRASRLPEAASGSSQAGTGRPAAITRQFTRRLAQPGAGTSGHLVRDWAAELGVSVGYLNDAVKQSTGRTPGQLIRQAQVLEAKRLLAGTSLTVRRVAREVGFADPAYFCRFFRREAGTTPGQFRREAAGNHHGPRALSIDAPPPPS